MCFDVYDVIFFCNDTATTEIYTNCHTRSLHGALPICETGKACIERRPVSQETCRRGVAQCLRSRDRPRHGSPVRATKISGAVPVGAAPERRQIGRAHV